MTDDWRSIESFSEDIQNEIKQKETPTCSFCGTALQVFIHRQTLEVPNGLELIMHYQFGCPVCKEFGYGGTFWDSICEYVRNYETRVVL